jgi:hypothetical protein
MRSMLRWAPRSLVLVAVVAAAALAPQAAADVPSATSEAFPSSQGRVHLFSGLHMFAPLRIPNKRTAFRIARRTASLNVSPGQVRGFVSALRSRRHGNPHLKLFAYVNGMFAMAGEGNLFPGSWYMRDRNGNKIRSKRWFNYLMDPRSTDPFVRGGVTYHGWTDWVRRLCVTRMSAIPGAFNGCFVDMLVPAPVVDPQYNVNNAVPVKDQATLAPWTPREWLTMTGGVGLAIQQFSKHPIVGNGLEWGARFYSNPNSLLLNYMTGAQAELWMRIPQASVRRFPSIDEWTKNVQMLMDGDRAGNALDVTVKVWTNATLAQRRRWQCFSFASYRLGNLGHSYFEFTSNPRRAPWQDWSKIYDLRIGSPLETYSTVAGYRRPSGIYRRTFKHGVVLVNPGGTRIRVRLHARYVNYRGAVLSAVTLRPHSGTVLKKLS